MSPDKGPRRHFTHQQIAPCFVSHEYEQSWGGLVERKIAKFFSNIKRLFKLNKS